VTKTATLDELETTWGLDDIIRANDVLDIMDKIQEMTMEGISK